MLKQEKNTKTRLALEKLGLGENEATLYTAMLEYPKVAVRELQQRTRFTRTMLYYILNNLIRLELISAVEEKGRTAYVPKNPEHLYDLLRKQQTEFEKQKEAIKEVIPELKNTYRLSQQRPGVRILEGIEGYRTFLTDILESQPRHLLTYLPGDSVKKPGLEMRQEFTLERITRKFEHLILSSGTEALKQWIAQTHASSYTETKICPNDLSSIDAELHLYAWKIAYVRYEKQEPIVTIIEDKKLYELQHNIFSHLWKQAKKTG